MSQNWIDREEWLCDIYPGNIRDILEASSEFIYPSVAGSSLLIPAITIVGSTSRID